MNIAIVITGFFVIEATLIFGLLYLRSLLVPPSLEPDLDVTEDRWADGYDKYIRGSDSPRDRGW